MKNRLIAALIAAFLLLPVFGLAVYAAEPEYTPEYAYATEYAYDPEDNATGECPDTEIQGTPYAENSYEVELPPLPPGTGTVIDFNTDPVGRLFFTIMAGAADEEHVFYLIVDTTSNINNVYFLNAVTVADLLPLAQMPTPPPSGTGGINVPPPTTTQTDDPAPPEQADEPAPPEYEPQNSGGMGMIAIVVLIIAGGGSAGWYFKIYRPKQQGAVDADEYDPAMDDMETDYTDDDWGNDEQGPDEADYDDTPPWDEDEESEDNEE